MPGPLLPQVAQQFLNGVGASSSIGSESRLLKITARDMGYRGQEALNEPPLERQLHAQLNGTWITSRRNLSKHGGRNVGA